MWIQPFEQLMTWVKLSDDYQEVSKQPTFQKLLHSERQLHSFCQLSLKAILFYSFKALCCNVPNQNNFRWEFLKGKMIVFSQIQSFHFVFLCCYCFFLIGVQLLYNVVLVSVRQQNESVLYIYIYPLFLKYPSSVGHHRTLSIEFPVLYSQFSVIYFIHSNVYMS